MLGASVYFSYMYNNARKCDMFNEILHTYGVRERLGPQIGEAVFANKVKQCCEVCKKPVYRTHSHKTSGVTCSNH